jgi:hypothetical protein
LQAFEIPQNRQSFLWKSLQKKSLNLEKFGKVQGGPPLFRHIRPCRSADNCGRGRRPRESRLVDLEKMRRSTTAALSERGYNFAGARSIASGPTRRRALPRYAAFWRAISARNSGISTPSAAATLGRARMRSR